MKLRKPLYKGRFNLAVNEEAMSAILKSGKTAQDWLRETIQIRLDHENREGSPLEALKGQLSGLRHHIDELAAEVKTLKNDQAKNHITTIGMDSDIRELMKQSAFVRQNQLELTHVLKQMDNNFSNAVNQLGPSLLVLLGQQLRDLIHGEIVKETKPKPRPPLQPPNL